MRQCPTLAGEDRPLIAHSIDNGLCMDRQRGFYHKCHRCVFNGKPADYVFPPPHGNGKVPTRERQDTDAVVLPTAKRD